MGKERDEYQIQEELPEQSLLTTTKDPVFPIAQTALKRTTCPLSLDTLDDHWNSNSYSSDDNILKNSSLKHKLPYRAQMGTTPVQK